MSYSEGWGRVIIRKNAKRDGELGVLLLGSTLQITICCQTVCFSFVKYTLHYFMSEMALLIILAILYLARLSAFTDLNSLPPQSG